MMHWRFAATDKVVTNKTDIEAWEKETQPLFEKAKEERDWGAYSKIAETRPKEVIRTDPIGVEILISYDPGETTDATQIGLLQVVRQMKDDTPEFLTKWHKEKQSVQGGSEKGFHIDTHAPRRNPLYATGKGEDKDKYLSDTGTPSPVAERNTISNSSADIDLRTELSDWVNWKDAKYKGLGEHGHRTLEGSGSKKKATLHDIPKKPLVAGDLKIEFETTALAIAGNQAGRYYGSVEWGLERKGSNMALTRLKLKSKGDPSSNFQKAIERWNQSTALREGTIKQDKTKVYKHPALDAPVEGTVSQGTKIEISRVEVYSDGAFYETSAGWIRDEDVEGSGPPVVPIPEPWKGEGAKLQGIRPPEKSEGTVGNKAVESKSQPKEEEEKKEKETKVKKKRKPRLAVILDAPDTDKQGY